MVFHFLWFLGALMESMSPCSPQVFIKQQCCRASPLNPVLKHFICILYCGICIDSEYVLNNFCTGPYHLERDGSVGSGISAKLIQK